MNEDRTDQYESYRIAGRSAWGRMRSLGLLRPMSLNSAASLRCWASERR